MGLIGNGFQKVLAVGAVCAVASCLVPGEAEAGIANGSGFPRNSSLIEFQLDTSVLDANPRRMVGYFPGAFKNYTRKLPPFPGRIVEFEPLADLTITKLQTDSQGRVPGLPFGLDTLQSDIFFPNFNFSNAFRADITFDSIIPQLIFFIQPNNCDLINNLSCFNRLNQNQIIGILPADVSSSNNGGVISNLTISPQVPRQRPVRRISAQSAIDDLTISQQVPEPTATGSLIGIGFLGALSLLKRHKRLQKSV